MKKQTPLVMPVAIFPYLVVLALLLIFTGALMDSVFQNNVFILLMGLAVAYVVALISAIILFATSLAAKMAASDVVRTNLILKLIQVPAYIAIFIIGIGCTITIFTIGISIILMILDGMTIALTGLIGLSAVIKSKGEYKISPQAAISHGILQFVFCADVVSAFLLSKAIRQTEHDFNHTQYVKDGAG